MGQTIQDISRHVELRQRWSCRPGSFQSRVCLLGNPCNPEPVDQKSRLMYRNSHLIFCSLDRGSCRGAESSGLSAHCQVVLLSWSGSGLLRLMAAALRGPSALFCAYGFGRLCLVRLIIAFRCFQLRELPGATTVTVMATTPTSSATLSLSL